MTLNLDNAFSQFKNDPNPQTFLDLQSLSLKYLEESVKPKKTTKKKVKQKEYKTSKGERRDLELNQILALFFAEGAEVVAEGENTYLEYWTLRDPEGNLARLYLSSEPWSMGKVKLTEGLKGIFEGYEDLDRFLALLADNDIEIDE